MSKSLFLLLLLVTLTTAGVSLQSGTLRFEGGTPAPSLELRADMVSLKSDAHVILRRIHDAPLGLHAVWVDLLVDWHDLSTDAAVEAHAAVQRVHSIFGSKSPNS